ncbi:hypothetical protein GCM10009805_07310 [Leucobacter chromiireducens subsp. solipictus]|uniref:ABC-2 type transport system permease protein n=1 Tax=Leucobacter chromiireducens subsp. solipictus TaxID=398235 RepID=A0ABS1SHX9_9MICO|nr:hypothetical protein [Leucobacter chromiireducens subsp. solipictus]
MPAAPPGPVPGASPRAPLTGLRAVRAIRRARGEQLSAGDVSYRVYLAVMLGITVVAPFVRTLVLGLAPGLPGTATTHTSTLAVALTLLTAGAVLLGGHLGPARAGLPQLDLLFTSPIPRTRLLAGSLLRWGTGGVLLGALAGGIVAVALLLSGPLGWGMGLAVVAGGACLGAILVGAQLLGQRGPSPRAGLAGGLLLLAGAQALLGGGGADAQRGVAPLPDPWSAAARVLAAAARAVHADALPQDAAAWSGSGVPGDLILLGAVALALGAAALPLASRLPRELLRAQAATWDSASTLALSGDPSAAVARFGVPVRWGRRLRLTPRARAGRAPHPLSLVVRRDLLGLLRAPGRSLAALCGVAAAGALWAAAVCVPRGIGGAALLGALALVCALWSLGPWCRGIAAAAGGAGAPPLLPFSPAGLILRHAVVALGLALLVTLIAGVAFVLVGTASAAPDVLAVLGTAPVFALATVLLRVAGALKGTIPLRLLAPVPTAAGDLAAVNVFLWSIDGPVVAALVGAALGAMWAAASGAGLLLALLGSLVLLAGLGAWARSRLTSGTEAAAH